MKLEERNHLVIASDLEEGGDKVGQSHPYSSLAGQNKKDLAPKSMQV